MIGLAAGWVAARRLWPERTGALAWWVAVGAAVGADSLLVYAWALAGKPGLGWLFAGEVAALAAALALPRPRDAVRGTGTERLPRSLVALLVAAGLSAAFGAFRTLHAYPYGEWDAIGIWNLRALLLVRGGLADAALAPPHPDYPLLVPLAVAHGWSELGERLAAPMILAAAFAAATPGLLFAASQRLVGRRAAAVLVIALLATPVFGYEAGSQRADVPLAFFMLASAVCLSFSGRLRAPSLLVLAGAELGCAAWTKNEGLVFAALLVGCWLVGGGRAALRRSWLLAAGALPFALALLHHKLSCGATTDLIARQGAQTWARLSDPARIATLAGAFATGGLWYAVAGTGLWWWLRRVRAREEGGGGAFLVWALVAMLAVDVGVYWTTPYDLEWHLWSSLDRVLLQLWPTALFALAVRVRAP